MSAAELTARVQAIADAPLAGHPQRRKGMPADVAAAIVSAVLDEVERLCEPLTSDWTGSRVVQAIRALHPESTPRPLAAPHSHANGKNGTE